MLNFNSLYNAVFNPVYPPFDSVRDYFTVIFDTVGFDVLYDDVSSRLKSMMNGESYVYYHSESESDLEKSNVEERLSEVTEMLDVRVHGDPPSRRYCILAYFDENNRSFESVLGLLKTIKREQKDVVTLLACMSKELADPEGFLKDMGFALKENAPFVDWYVFSDLNTKYYRRLLEYSICGVIINGSTISLQAQKSTRRANAEMAVNNYIETQLSDEGKSWVKSLPNMSWSTACYKYYDHQYDFLCKYLLDVCKNLKALSKETFFGMLDNYYETLVSAKDNVRIRSIMEKSIDLMPYVISSVGKGNEVELCDFYRTVYGDRGPSAVELTLKTTLASLYNYNPTGIIDDCVNRLFSDCSGYADANIYANVCGLLKQRIEELEQGCASINSSLKFILSELVTVETYRDIQKKYIDKFHNLYVKQKEMQFWTQVLDNISRNPENYTECCKLSSDCYNEIQNLIRSRPAVTPYDGMKIKTVELSAAEILDLDSNTKVCGHIKESFSLVGGGNEGKSAPDSCSPVFDVNFDPNFYRGEKVNYSNAAYELCGLELNGRYLVSLGG